MGITWRFPTFRYNRRLYDGLSALSGMRLTLVSVGIPMSLIVQKYGGTSVGSIERIQNVAEKVISWRERGHQIVVVVSAMSGETDRLIGLAKEITSRPLPRELDVMLSTGEQVTIALLCIALGKRGCPARSYTGSQVRILTDNAFSKARIQAIEADAIRSDLDSGKVVL